jgi:hypothetical protein
MSIPLRTPHEQEHWRKFNIWARLLGIGFTVGGLVFINNAWRYSSRSASDSGVAALSGSPQTDALVAGAVVLLFGILLLTRPAYRPDLGDSALSDRTFRVLWGLPGNWGRPRGPDSSQLRRSWWTGERKSARTNDGMKST